jgi:hypothetical protein
MDLKINWEERKEGITFYFVITFYAQNIRELG